MEIKELGAYWDEQIAKSSRKDGLRETGWSWVQPEYLVAEA